MGTLHTSQRIADTECIESYYSSKLGILTSAQCQSSCEILQAMLRIFFYPLYAIYIITSKYFYPFKLLFTSRQLTIKVMVIDFGLKIMVLTVVHFYSDNNSTS